MTGVIVAGMHRSGTSLLTSFLDSGGWHCGEEQLSTPTENYREDASFVALHRSWLDAILPPGFGHHDWGISSAGVVELPVTDEDKRAMAISVADFVALRNHERPRWVAKDPRASLFLPVWLEQSELKFVFVYRNPWDVLDSAMRLSFGPFCAQPQLVLGAWLDYNRRIIDAITRFPKRCSLIASEMLLFDPAQVWNELGNFVGMHGAASDALVDSEKYVHRDDNSAIAQVYRDIYPQHVELLARLDLLAKVGRSNATPIWASGRKSHTPPRHGGTLPVGTGVQVIIPCRNDGQFLAEAIASVDDCANGRVELTIIDDGSTDTETLRIMAALSASGRDVIMAPAQGLASARNTAAAKSRTAAVLPLDSDNRLRIPLIRALDLIENGTTDIVHGPWRQFGMQSQIVTPPSMTMDNLVPHNTIDACALISRVLLDQLGGWDEGLRFYEDWDLWLGAVRQGARSTCLDRTTFDYLVRPGSLSNTAADNRLEYESVIARITIKHESLLGPTVSRLVREIHCLSAARHKENRA